jgi:hypothetical protein
MTSASQMIKEGGYQPTEDPPDRPPSTALKPSSSGDSGNASSDSGRAGADNGGD